MGAPSKPTSWLYEHQLTKMVAFRWQINHASGSNSLKYCQMLPYRRSVTELTLKGVKIPLI